MKSDDILNKYENILRDQKLAIKAAKKAKREKSQKLIAKAHDTDLINKAIDRSTMDDKTFKKVKRAKTVYRLNGRVAINISPQTYYKVLGYIIDSESYKELTKLKEVEKRIRTNIEQSSGWAIYSDQTAQIIHDIINPNDYEFMDIISSRAKREGNKFVPYNKKDADAINFCNNYADKLELLCEIWDAQNEILANYQVKQGIDSELPELLIEKSGYRYR